ncbi:MAG TPA: hypothetical protein DC054_12800 [Blastocatellia bacterium]|nr:hypothetical protein [Blastocatellia bacterium]
MARIYAAVQLTLILLGWALAQFPNLVEPDIAIYSAAARRATVQLLLIALAAGGARPISSYYYLLRVFKVKLLIRRDGIGRGS